MTGPIDWDAFWRDADEARRATATPGAHGKADHLARFFDHVGVPNDLASVGCGPAHAEFALADRYDSLEVYGFDAARSVVEQNRRRAADEGRGDVRFAVAALPELGIDRRFDLVYCYATLTYVADVESALAALHGLVRPGGYLVFDYPNRHTRATYRRHLREETVPDPAWFRERWRLVLDGENLLSHRRIHDVLDRWPRSLYAAIDRTDAPRDSPCVFVPR